MNPERPLIYLASPYTNSDPAVVDARFRDVCAAAGKLMLAGHHVWSPIASSHPIAVHGELPTHWEFWRDYDTAMIRACAEVWVLMLDGWRESKGVTAEIEIAKGMGRPVRYVNRALAVTDAPPAPRAEHASA